MFTDQTDIEKKNRTRAAEIANTFEWLITAFILAFVFRAFVMEAFRIPTGSMADTLMGSHFRICCLQCGYEYELGFSGYEYGYKRDICPAGNVNRKTSHCPNCGYTHKADSPATVSGGDRILVLKCIYQFFQPNRWDPVVFKNPLNPNENYIKRLIGKPGETVEIIDGDIYIDGRIARKPSNVQDELWMIIYDNDYQPVRPNQGSFNGHKWKQPFKNENSQWTLDPKDPRKFCLDSSPESINTLVYDSSVGNDFRASYAYNNMSLYKYRPYCSDLMVRSYVDYDELQGKIGIEMSKYRTVYRGWIDLTGQMVITKTDPNGSTVELNSRYVAIRDPGRPMLVKFTNVDHELTLNFGKETLRVNIGAQPDAIGPRQTDIEPVVKIFAAGKMKLSHTAIFRDIHYTARKYANSPVAGRAVEGNPLSLEEDQFFVLGDNSPGSEDGRWWDEPGMGNNGKDYRAGIVPRDYLVGKAVLVYWPSGFKPFDGSRLAIIPNVGRMRFIYGGRDETL